MRRCVCLNNYFGLKLGPLKQKHWQQPFFPPCLCFLGYCGADVKAVCSEAALCALRRRYPQIYYSSQKLVLDVNSIAITNKDFVCAMSKIVPASQRYNQNGCMMHFKR